MPEDSEIAILEKAHTPMEATVITAVLRAAGIPAYVNGTLLQDEFAVIQRLLNLGAVEVQVPRDRLEEARAILEAAREAGTGSLD